MALILCLETATTVCSVALGKNGKLLAMREANQGYTHSENLTIFTEQVLAEAGCTFDQLDAIAVSKGPGSYTGLRIGVSAAKGFCFALDKPLIAVNTLRAMAYGVGQTVDLSLALSGGEGNSGMVEEDPGYYTADWKDYHKLLERAKRNRKNPTFAEKIMWQQLRNRNTGYKFRRQHPVGKFIPDFVCLEKNLIVEVDGASHSGREMQDAERTKKLEALGYIVVRFTNEQVVEELDRVIAEIKAALEARSSNEEEVSEVNEDEAVYSIQGKAGAQAPLSTGEGRGEVRGPLLCPMIDARRMEVYCAFYDLDNNEVRPTSAEIITEDSFKEILKENKVIFFGDGAFKCRQTLTHPNAMFIDNAFPSAEYLLQVAESKCSNKEFEDVAYFEPYYLKDFVAGGKK